MSGRDVKTKSRDCAIASPYNLSFSENPGTLISSLQLNGENYAEWAHHYKKTWG